MKLIVLVGLIFLGLAWAANDVDECYARMDICYAEKNMLRLNVRTAEDFYLYDIKDEECYEIVLLCKRLRDRLVMTFV